MVLMEKEKKDFTDIEWKGNNILLFGSEGFGMHQHTSKYADFLVKIDIDNKIESLNISNSAAIVFHHLSYIKKKELINLKYLIIIAHALVAQLVEQLI